MDDAVATHTDVTLATCCGGNKRAAGVAGDQWL
jgi:hypothetical protein